MQMAVLEFARNVLGLANAESTEVNSQTPYPVVNLMEEQKNVTDKGGTMRLGAWKCNIKSNTKLHKIYQNTDIEERHRHRYEFNNEYLASFEENGFIASGINPETGLVEAMELDNHPFFVGVQYHPEYKSYVEQPHPLFIHFIKAALTYKS